MPTKVMRKMVRIDEEKCDGCGQCAPNCAEGALKILNGKARLVAENLCDGLGACLGTCPRGAITIDEQPADEFDEKAVQSHLGHAVQGDGGHGDASPPQLVPHVGESSRSPMIAMPSHEHGGGCPGSRLRLMPEAGVAVSEGKPANGPRPSRLGQWPVQLALVPPAGPMWDNADVLIAADCVPFAYPDFHEKLLAGRRLAIACPKLDDMEPYLAKLTHILANNNIRSITVAHMEVPCCGGIVRLVKAALAAAGRQDIPVADITVGVDGTMK